MLEELDEWEGCIDCDIETKITYCCSSHPETGKSRLLKTETAYFQACPELNRFGECKIYNERPEACKFYECPRLKEFNLLYFKN